MGVVKVVNKSTKSKKALRNVLNYVLAEHKTTEEYVGITGPYNENKITSEGVYKAFMNEKRIWGKDEDNGKNRMYQHAVISFHKDEKITYEEALAFGMEFVQDYYKDFQSLVCVHKDREHIHIHCISNSISFVNGKKFVQSKKDLYRMRDINDQLCLARGLTITEKGKHFDGTNIEEGQLLSWNKDKYYILQNKPKESIVFNCYVAILTALENCISKEMFINNIKKIGYDIIYKDSRKNITFISPEGVKIRDSKLSKTFNINISKGGIEDEFKKTSRRKQEHRRNKQRHEETIETRYERRLYEYKEELQERERELQGYYNQLEEKIKGKGTDNKNAEKTNRDFEGGIDSTQVEWEVARSGRKRSKRKNNRGLKEHDREAEGRDNQIER